MDNHIATLVQQFFKHLTSRDLPQLLSLFAEQVDWYIPGDADAAPWLGRRNNRAQVEDFYQLLWKNTQPLTADVELLLTNENSAVITGTFSTKMLATNKVVNSPFSIQITFTDGLITRYVLMEDSYAVHVAMS